MPLVNHYFSGLVVSLRLALSSALSNIEKNQLNLNQLSDSLSVLAATAGTVTEDKIRIVVITARFLRSFIMNLHLLIRMMGTNRPTTDYEGYKQKVIAML